MLVAAEPIAPRLAEVIAAADFYRGLELNPIPSRVDEKRPVVRWKRLREHPMSKDSFDEIAARHFAEHGNVGIQCVTGARWRLAVVDLDGDMPIAVWDAWARFRPNPPTWKVVGRNADGSVRGMHLWYSVPPGSPCRSRRLWGLWDDAAGDWAHRSLVEFLADKRLIVSPPSQNPRTGMPYEWLPGSSPSDLPRPAPLPAWVAALPDLKAPRGPEPAWSHGTSFVRPSPATRGVRFDHADVLGAIPDKVAVARDFGLRIVGERPDADGWVRCRAIGREDRTPSASFNANSGYFVDHSSNERLSLFDIGSLIGGYRTWGECCNALGCRYAAKPPAKDYDASPA